MKIRPVGAELFHADGRTDRQADRQDRQTLRSYSLFFAILRKNLKMVQKRMRLLVKGEY